MFSKDKIMNWYKTKHFYKNKYLLSKIVPDRYFLCYNYKYKALWFRVAKVGSRTIDSHFREHTPAKQYIYSSSTPYNPNDFKDFFKFAFVRNPRERLISAWKNKVLENNYFNFNGSEHKEMQNLDNFLDWISDMDLRKCDEHLRLQSSLIDINNLDFLGRMENFSIDYAFVARKIGLSVSQVATKNQTGKVPIVLTERQIKIIRKLYMLDYQIFYNHEI